MIIHGSVTELDGFVKNASFPLSALQSIFTLCMKIPALICHTIDLFCSTAAAPAASQQLFFDKMHFRTKNCTSVKKGDLIYHLGGDFSEYHHCFCKIEGLRMRHPPTLEKRDIL